MVYAIRYALYAVNDGGFARVAKCCNPPFICPYRCHMSPHSMSTSPSPSPYPLSLASNPPGKPYPLLTSHNHSLTHSLILLSTLHSPLHTLPLYPSPLQQPDSLLPLTSTPFPSLTILPLFHFTTAFNHFHSSRVEHPVTPNLSPVFLYPSSSSNYPSLSPRAHRLSTLICSRCRCRYFYP
jgi:hypothetical protein